MNATTSDVAAPESFVIYHERNWPFLCFIPVWMVFWLFGEILVGYLILRGLPGLPAEFRREGWWACGGLLIAVVLISWFSVWTYVGWMLSYAWLWNAFGRECLSVGDGELTIERSCLGWRRVSRYVLDDVKSLRQAVQWGRIAKMMRVGQMRERDVRLLTFDYRGKEVEFGFGITNTAATTIVTRLDQLHPSIVISQDQRRQHESMQQPEHAKRQEFPNLWARWLHYIGTGIVVFGVLSWFVPSLKMSGLFDVPANVELPLGDLQGIAVDDQGRLYCGAQFWQRVQVYDQDGTFVRGWSVNASGGAFLIRAKDDGFIHVATARGEMHYTYRPDGTIVAQQHQPHLFEEYPTTATTDGNGNRYEVRSPFWFPAIVRIDPEGQEERVVITPWYLWLVQEPLPGWLFVAVGMIMMAVGRGFPDLFLKPELKTANGEQPRGPASPDG